jgi:hypothetical protein
MLRIWVVSVDMGFAGWLNSFVTGVYVITHGQFVEYVARAARDWAEREEE